MDRRRKKRYGHVKLWTVFGNRDALRIPFQIIFKQQNCKNSQEGKGVPPATQSQD